MTGSPPLRQHGRMSTAKALLIAIGVVSCASASTPAPTPPLPSRPAEPIAVTPREKAPDTVDDPPPDFRYVTRTESAERAGDEEDRQARVAAGQAAFRSGCAADRELRARERVRLLALANARRDYEAEHCKAVLLTRTIPNNEVRSDSSGHLVRGADTVTQRLATCNDPPDVAAAEAKRRADQSRLEHRDMGCYFEDQAAKGR